MSWRHGVYQTIRQSPADLFTHFDTVLFLMLLLKLPNYSLNKSVKVEHI